MKKYKNFIKLGIYMLLMGALASKLTACGNRETGDLSETFLEETDYKLKVTNVQDFEVNSIDGYQEGRDWDWSYLNAYTMSSFAKAGDNYYVRLGEYVYICDFEKGELIPLCNRPNCLHNNEDTKKREDCIAYVGLGNYNEGLQYYNGKLYANSSYQNLEEESEKTGDQIYELALDGSTKEIFDYNFQNSYNFMIHRDCIYYTTVETDPETMINTETIYCVNIENKTEKQIAQVEGSVTFEIRPYGEYVYISIILAEDDVAPKIIYEISTGRTKIVKEEWRQFYFPDNENEFLTCSTVEPNKQLVELLNKDEVNRRQIGEVILDDSEHFGLDTALTKHLFNWVSADDSYLYIFGMIDDEPIMAIFNKENCELIQILSLDSNPIYQCLGVNDIYIFYVCDHFYSGADQVYWMKKEDMLKPGAKFSMMEP